MRLRLVKSTQNMRNMATTPDVRLSGQRICIQKRLLLLVTSTNNWNSPERTIVQLVQRSGSLVQSSPSGCMSIGGARIAVSEQSSLCICLQLRHTRREPKASQLLASMNDFYSYFQVVVNVRVPIGEEEHVAHEAETRGPQRVEQRVLSHAPAAHEDQNDQEEPEHLHDLFSAQCIM